MQLNAYLMYDGNCREAFEFYERALGARNAGVSTYGDMPDADPGMPAAQRDRVIHVRLEHPDGWVLMGSDMPPGMPYQGIEGVSMSLQVGSAAEGDRVYAALLEGGGEATMPMGETFWAERFGMLKDRFGLNWMVNFDGAKAKAA